MRKNIIAMLVFVTILLPVICSAASGRPGAYVSGFLGITVPSNTDVSSTDFVTGRSFNDRTEFDPGINLGATGGYDFGMIRLEGELSYKRSELKNITDQASGNRFRSVDGNLGALAMMFNAFFDLHNRSIVTPYLGGGIGFASLHLSDTSAIDTSGGQARNLLLYGASDATVFAYQAGAGLEIALNHRLSLDIGYRYFATDSGDFDSDVAITSRMKFESHNAALGVRYKF